MTNEYLWPERVEDYTLWMTSMKKHVWPVVIFTTLMVVMVVVYVLGNRYMEIQESQVRAEAVQGCMTVSSFTYENGEGVTTVEPIEKTYTKCLELKGY
jgi:hypothetical protein